VNSSVRVRCGWAELINGCSLSPDAQQASRQSLGCSSYKPCPYYKEGTLGQSCCTRRWRRDDAPAINGHSQRVCRVAYQEVRTGQRRRSLQHALRHLNRFAYAFPAQTKTHIFSSSVCLLFLLICRNNAIVSLFGHVSPLFFVIVYLCIIKVRLKRPFAVC